MDALTITDVRRMMLSISHESANRAKELKLEAISEYEAIKDRMVDQGQIALDKKFKSMSEELENERKKSESNLRKKYKMLQQLFKEKILDDLFSMTEKILTNLPLNRKLLEQTLERNTEDEIYVFSRKTDHDFVLSHTKGTSCDIMELPDEALGGVVICTKNGKEVWDNSFSSRLQSFKERDLQVLNKEIFSQK